MINISDFFYKPNIQPDRNYNSDAYFDHKKRIEELEYIEHITKEEIENSIQNIIESVKFLPPDINNNITDMVRGIRYILGTINANGNRDPISTGIIITTPDQKNKGSIRVKYLDKNGKSIIEDSVLRNISGKQNIFAININGYMVIEPNNYIVNVIENKEYLVVFYYNKHDDDLIEGEIKGSIRIRYLNINERSVLPDMVLKNVSGKRTIKSQEIDNYISLNPKIYTVDVKEQKEYIITFYYKQKSEDNKDPDNIEDDFINGSIRVKYLNLKDETISDDFVIKNVKGFKTINAININGYKALDPTRHVVNVTQNKEYIMKFYYMNSELDIDNIFGTISIGYLDLDYNELIERKTFFNTKGGIYSAIHIEGYTVNKPSSVKLEIKEQGQILKYDFIYNKTNNDKDLNDKDIDDEKIIILEDIEYEPIIIVDVVNTEKEKVIIAEYESYTSSIIKDYVNKLESIVTDYLNKLFTTVSDIKITDLSYITKKYDIKTETIKNKDFVHLSDRIIKSQIEREQLVRAFKKIFNKKGLQKHLRTCKTTSILNARYHKGDYSTNKDYSSIMTNKMLLEARQEYDKKTHTAFLNFYKYLNSSTILLKELFDMIVDENQGKSILIEKEGVKL